MEITVKSAKVLKSGTNKNGEWELVGVTSEDGTNYATFHKSAKNITPGSVIEFEPDIKEGKISFKEYKVVSQGAPAPAGNGNLNQQSGMTPDMWAEKDKITRKSIEDQTRAKIIAELVIADKANDTLAKKLNDYLSLLGDSTEPLPEATSAKSTASKPVSSATVFNNAGSLKTAMKETLKMTGLEIAAATAGYDLATEKGRKNCWAATLELREGKPDEKVTTEKETDLDPEKLFE